MTFVTNDATPVSSTTGSSADSGTTPDRLALVVGATGIAGSAITDQLAGEGWNVLALSRRPGRERAGVRWLSADLTSAEDLKRVLGDEKPTHVYFTAWSRQATEQENIDVNSGMVRDLGPFEAYGQGNMPDTPFHEEEERLDAPNFYYAQEDELFLAAKRDNFTWSVHRSHTVIGHAVGNAMNMGLTLAVYASICRALDKPFIFPGSLTQWNGVTDMTDATVLADQMIWASTSENGRDEAFNVVNGDIFRWRWMWPRLAAHFGVTAVGPESEPNPLETQMVGMEATWAEIAAANNLAESDLGRLASWWHTDADLGREIEVVTDITKSRLAGFTTHHRTIDSFTALFERYEDEALIPPVAR
jgi:nucleoside-diphosphate-sugar epimerase